MCLGKYIFRHSKTGEIKSVSWVGITEAIRTVSITTEVNTLVTGRASLVNATVKLHLVLAQKNILAL